jgi:hypothetical protein
MAGEILTDQVNQDLTDVASKREAINCGAYLPPAWQIGLDEEFMAGMANAMRFVTKGLTEVGWEGPANTAEELCLKAILDHASDVIPEVWKVKDIARLKADVMDLRESGFQDIDHEFLFEPEMDGIDKVMWAPTWECSLCPGVMPSRGLHTASPVSKVTRSDGGP